MGASKIQLFAIGPQDFHLTANPQITFFKKVYKRHTNFSIETVNFSFDEKPQLKSEAFVYTSKIRQDGDLLKNLYLEVDIKGTVSDGNKGSYTINHFGYSLIKKANLYIGGRNIETLYSQWMLIYDELNKKNDENSQRENLSSTNGGRFTYNINNVGFETTFNHELGNKYISMKDRTKGNCPLVFGGGLDGKTDYITDGGSYTKKMYIPLNFFFTKNHGLYLPVCALYNHEIKIEIELETLDNLRGTSNITFDNNSFNMTLHGEYIILDDDEKSKFVQSTHEYLIEQVQLNTNSAHVLSSTSENNVVKENSISIEFKHPVKYFTWAVVNEGTALSNSGMGPCYFVSMCKSNLYGDDGIHGEISLYLNGEEREKLRPVSYYTRYLIDKYCDYTIDSDRIGIYSFSLNPFSHDPSGTCNFSRLKDSYVMMSFSNNDLNTLKGKKLYIFGVNYNIFLINNGMAMIRYN